MFIELEGLRGGVFEALANAAADAGERALAASALKVLVADKARFVVNQGIQVHGGVGTVNDYKISHCFKRVFALETLYGNGRSEEHTSELQSLMRISYAVFCLKKKNN